MTCLASNPGVLAFVLFASDIAVASLAGFAARKLDLPRSDLLQSGSAKVSVLTKVSGDDRVANQKECGHPQEEQEYYSKQVFGASNELLHAPRLMQFRSPCMLESIKRRLD